MCRDISKWPESDFLPLSKSVAVCRGRTLLELLPPWSWRWGSVSSTVGWWTMWGKGMVKFMTQHVVSAPQEWSQRRRSIRGRGEVTSLWVSRRRAPEPALERWRVTFSTERKKGRVWLGHKAAGCLWEEGGDPTWRLLFSQRSERQDHQLMEKDAEAEECQYKRGGVKSSLWKVWKWNAGARGLNRRSEGLRTTSACLPLFWKLTVLLDTR